VSIGLLYWILYVIAVIFGPLAAWPRDPATGWRPFGGSLLLFVLLFLIGWKLFGPILNG
jgi:hypothetical protein